MNDSNILEDQPIAWTPTPEVIERAQLTRFMKQVGVSTWDELYQFSIRDVEKFTEEVLKFLDIRFDPPYEKLLDTSYGVEFPKWFGRSGDTHVPIGGSSAERSSERRSDGRSGDTPVPIGGSSAERSSERRSDKRSADTPVPIGGSSAERSSERRSDGRSGDTPVPIGGSSAEGSSERRSDVRGDKSVPAPAGLNITTMCLDRWRDSDKTNNSPALIWEGEYSTQKWGDSTTWSYRRLAIQVLRFASGLKNRGLKKGDAIGIHLPMLPETVVALLAINRIGAILVPVFSGYGVEAIASRMNAVNAKALITCDGFYRRGKFFDALEIAEHAVTASPTVKDLIVVRNTSRDINYHLSDISYSEFTELWDPKESKLSYPEPTSAEDPLIILYTSGTTGKPKGIAHTHASFPIKAAQDMAFGTDVGKGTRISWYTDIGWMMGPWLIYGALINGATICIYDGAPDYPTPDRMWEFCAKHKVEVLGISPTLIRSLARSGDTLVPTDVASTSGSTLGGGTADGDESVPALERKGWYRSLKLPHYDGEVTQFITFRLADSLPKGVLDRMKLELEHDKLGDDSEAYRQRIEDYLDQGAGECILRRPEIARIVAETILFEHEKSCDLKAWVVMPNHAHILLRMRAGNDLAGLMKRVKGISSRRINELMDRIGPVWQADYFDRYIRDAEHFDKVFRYIENNPVVAGLSETPDKWQFGSAGWSGDTLVPIGGSSAETYSERRSDVHGDKSVPAPFKRHDLSSLRIFASTGEPWNPAPWWWLFEKVGNSKLPIINYSGGTEIAGGILMGNPLLPEKPCSFPAPCPGMDVDIVDDEGKSVEAGKVGELVIKQPWIGMARGFWQEKERYLETYWSRFKNIWVHGDFAMRDKDGHWFILGRSDDTLKVAGKRVGPAEVESLLVAHPLVTEAAVIGIPDEVKGTAMIAFVVRSGDTPVPTDVASTSGSTLGGGTADGDKSVPAPLEAELKSLVARDMGKPLAPSRIHFVSALPKTRNAKVMRRVIRSAYLGEDLGDLSALENPQAIIEIREANR